MTARAVLVSLLLNTLLLQNCLFAQSSPTAKPVSDPEAYAIYSAVLESALKPETPGTPVIQVETESFANCVNSANRQLEVTEAVNNYVTMTSKKWVLERQFTLSLPYEMMHADEIKTNFEAPGDGWERFYQRFPKSPGIFTFSAVGFNADKTVAVVYMGNQCHWLCGGGTQHVLEKSDGKWRKMKGVAGGCAWVS